MKKCIVLIVLSLLIQVALAQDVIVKVNGDEINAKVLEITLSEVIYLSPDSANDTQYRIAKAEVFMVRFANGAKEVFQENLPVVTETGIPMDPAQMYDQGKQDALQYYNGRGAMWGSVASTFALGPLIGPLLIVATKPKAVKNENLPKQFLLDPNYVKGYEKQAYKRKAGKTAIGAGIGAAAYIALIHAISNSY